MTTPRDSSSSYQNGGGSFGRDFRMVLGGVALIADFVLYYLDHVRRVPPAVVDTHDLIIHGAWAFCALFLMDPRRLIEILGQVKDRIPLIGGK